jgi:hypothetical protein
MANEITPYSGGGSVIVPDAVPAVDGGHMAMPSRSDLARARAAAAVGDHGLAGLTDAQHFASFESKLRSAFAERGVRDSNLVSQIARETEDLYSSVGAKYEGDNPFELLGVLAQRLVQVGISNPHAVGAAVEVAANYLFSMVPSWDPSESGNDEERDDRDFQQARATLKSQWGTNYRGTVRTIRDHVNTKLPPSLADAIWDGRDADGRRLANSVDVLMFLANQAQGGAGGGRGASFAETDREIAKIEKFMRTNRADYNKDAALQQRYLELIRLRDGVE